jgi:(+)-trans-carveol dehydrogenase
MGRLTDRVAFVTGAARGQGRAHCVRLAEEGADIIAIDIAGPVVGSPVEPATMEQLEETRGLVEKSGRRALIARADVRDYDSMKHVVDEGVRRFGRLDVVVANAGTMRGGHMWELTEDQWQLVIDVNLTGVWKTIKATVPHMIEAGNGGSIIITSSAAGYRGYPMSGGYGAAKHGLVGLCQTLAVEVARYTARDEEATVGGVAGTIAGAFMTGEPLVDELVVMDSDSTDRTAEVAAVAGATVYRCRDVAGHLDAYPGKGEALWKSLLVTTGDIVVFVDADLTRWGTHFVTGLLGPLLDPAQEILLVKACYDRVGDGPAWENAPTSVTRSR